MSLFFRLPAFSLAGGRHGQGSNDDAAYAHVWRYDVDYNTGIATPQRVTPTRMDDPMRCMALTVTVVRCCALQQFLLLPAYRYATVTRGWW